VIGLGYWGPNIVRNLAGHKEFKLVACADKIKKNRDKIIEIFPDVQMFDSGIDLIEASNVDAVAIATPAIYHFDLASHALKKGIHVLVEKPMVLKTNHAIELSSLSKKNNASLMTDHILLYSEPIKELVRIYKKGELGNILFFRTTRSNLGSFRPDIDVIWDIGTHELSVLDLLFGSVPKLLHVSRGKIDKIKNTAVSTIFLEFNAKAKVTGDIHVSLFAPEKTRQMLFCGDKKMVLFDDLDVNSPLKIFDRGVAISGSNISYRRNLMVSPDLPAREPLRNVLDEFRKRIVSCEFGNERGARLTNILENISKVR